MVWDLTLQAYGKSGPQLKYNNHIATDPAVPGHICIWVFGIAVLFDPLVAKDIACSPHTEPRN